MIAYNHSTLDTYELFGEMTQKEYLGIIEVRQMPS